jgi:hypothetical protein
LGACMFYYIVEKGAKISMDEGAKQCNEEMKK